MEWSVDRAPKRLGYRKSRTGCSRCKERRVKCDEGRPCRACVRHGLVCSLEGSSPESESSARLSSSAQEWPSLDRSVSSKFILVSVHQLKKWYQAARVRTRRQPLAPAQRAGDFDLPTLFGSTGSDEYTSPPDPFHFFSGLLVDYKPENASNWIMDVELMHHYTASAYKTLTPSPDAQDALQHDLPREGLRHPYLMHQILAFAGFHLAYTQPERRHIYLKQASQHQNFTIHGMRKALAGSISSENCHATYATSIFISLGAFAVYPCYENYNTFFSPIDSLVEIFTLITGMGLILSTSDDELRTGPLKRLFKKRVETGGPDHPCPQLSGRLPFLEAQLDEVITELGQDVQECIKKATSALQDCLDKVATRNSGLGNSALRAAFLWPLLLSAQCLDWIKCRHPAAMVILAHYAMLLYSAEADCWYLRGWGRAIAESVAEALAGTSWLNLARRPISVVRGE